MEDLNSRLHDEPLDQPTDTELAARIYAGDNEAFAELWQRHRTSVSSIARRHGAAPQDVEDLEQETALKLWLDLQKNNRNFDGEGKSVRSYAGRIAANKTIDTWRKRDRRPEELVESYGDYSNAIVTATEDAPETIVLGQMNVDELLGQVKPERREPMQAVYIDDLSIDTYAEQAGIPRGTALSRTHRGRAELQAIIAAQELEQN